MKVNLLRNSALATALLVVLFWLAVENVDAACANNANTHFRSAAAGVWNNTATWECSDDGVNWQAATFTPTSANGTLTIRNGHTVTIAATVTYDQLIINAGGQVSVAPGIPHTLANGTGTDLSIDGTWLNQGGTWTVTGAAWSVNAGGTFVHNTTSGIATPLDVATLAATSNFVYRGSSALTPAISVSGRTYGNLSIESTSGALSLSSTSGASALTLNGNFSVGATGAGTVTYATVGFTGAISLNGNVTIGSGSTWTVGSSQITLKGNWSNGGTFNSGTSTSTFVGTLAQTISGSSATTFSGLTINNSNGVSLSGVDATVNAVLTLTSGDLNTGANRLTMGSAATTVSTANDVVGNVLRNTPGTGATALSYGSQWTTIKFDTTAPVSMTVSLTKPITAPFQDAVKRQYTLTPSSPLTNTATIQLHVNASDETEKNEQAVNSLNLYRFTGSTWAFVGATLRSTSAGVPGTSPSSWVSKTGVTTFSPWGIGGISSPTTVRLSKFEARVADNEVALNWTTGSETNAAGFNIYRSESWDGPYACLNAQLIPTAANSIAGGSYRYEDPTVVPGRTYFYQLEDVELNGASVRHSPVTVFVGDTRATVAVPWLEILGVTGLATLMACWIFLGIKKRS